MFKNIRSNGLNIWAVLLLVCLYILLKFLLAIGLLEVIENLIDDTFLQIEFGDFLSTSIILILFVFFFKNILTNTEESGIRFPKLKIILYVIITVIGLRFLEDPFFRYKNIFFNEPLPNTLNFETMELTLDIIFKAVHIVILAPILEELLFRKIIFKSLLKKYSNLWVAILISSILFSLIHLSIRNTIPTLLFGMTSAYIYYKTSNIWYSIIAHILKNLIWFTVFINPKYYWKIHQELNLGIGYWLLVVFGIGLIIITLNQYQKLKAKKD